MGRVEAKIACPGGLTEDQVNALLLSAAAMGSAVVQLNGVVSVTSGAMVPDCLAPLRQALDQLRDVFGVSATFVAE